MDELGFLAPSFPIALLTGVEGFTTQEDQEMLSRIEKQLKRRFAIGSQVSEHSIVQDFTKQVSEPF
jgi:translation initiation factor 1 (eIF-1/SUI1)